MAKERSLVTKEPGIIVTFYSYKGGVGRTFALVNVAAQLTMWGYRVLCVDWDLEAPGFDTFFGDCYNEIQEGSPQKDGLIGLICRLSESQGSIDRQEMSRTILPYIANYLLEPSEDWKIDILFAGPVHRPEYGQWVASIDWHQLFEETGLGEKIEAWRAWARDKYDFVLIDSRTGFSDTGSICTMHLPDILAVVFTTNGQSLVGAVRAASRAVEGRNHYYYSDGKLRVLPLLSRIDRGAQDHAVWIERTVMNGSLDRFYDDWLSAKVAALDMLNATLIPYTLTYAYGEPIAVIKERSQFVAEVCQNPILLTYTFQNIAGVIKHNLGRSAELIYNREGFIGSAIDVARSSLDSRQGAYDSMHGRVVKEISLFDSKEDKDRRLYEVLLLKFELLISEARWSDARVLIVEINKMRRTLHLSSVVSPERDAAEPYMELLNGLRRGLIGAGPQRGKFKALAEPSRAPTPPAMEDNA